MRACKRIPDLSVKVPALALFVAVPAAHCVPCRQVEPFVEGETKIAQKDLVTLRVTLTRENLEEGQVRQRRMPWLRRAVLRTECGHARQRAGMIYAPHFPVPRREVWWLLLLDEKNKMVGSAIISDDHREVGTRWLPNCA